jgi:hypothetical protein
MFIIAGITGSVNRHEMFTRFENSGPLPIAMVGAAGRLWTPICADVQMAPAFSVTVS